MKLSQKTMRKITIIMLVVVLWVIFALITDNFVTPRNTVMLLKDSAYVGLISIGMCFALVCGGVDISAGGIVSAVAIIGARASFIPGIPGFMVVVICAGAGLLMGLVNAILITKLHLTDFVATLASGIAYGGLAYVFAFHNKTTGIITSKGIENPSFLAIGKAMGADPMSGNPGIYPIIIAWIILSILAFIFLTRTKFGTHIYASGSNPAAAKMSGVNADFIKGFCYMLSGMMAGIAAAFVVANQTAASSSVGTGYEFQAMTACVVGGVVLGGGKGDHINALFGAIFMTLIINGLNKFGLSVAYTYLAEGIIIIVATAYDSVINAFLLKRQISKNIEAVQAAHAREGGASE